MRAQTSDRDVELKGGQLKGLRLDFIVAGGIAGIESPKMIRELRRYGAEVRVIMTEAATRFVSPIVFEWASKNLVVTDLTGSAEHITEADAVIVAPATLDLISKIAQGIGDSAAAILLQSALGRLPIFLAPSMHLSLEQSPAYQRNLQTLCSWPKIEFLEGVREEGKAKTVDFEEAVARISHSLCASRLASPKTAVISLGPTRSYADDLRFLSNVSTGALGKAIAMELFRSGVRVHCISGPIQTSLPAFLNPIFVETAEEMRKEFQRVVDEKLPEIAIFSAAVLDFEIEKRLEGKTPSSLAHWSLSLKPSPKLIQSIQAKHRMLRVGFKLESQLSVEALHQRVVNWVEETPCDILIANRFEDLPQKGVEHRAYLYLAATKAFHELQGKKQIASKLVEVLLTRTSP